jgi:thymidylate synthase (FAD)
MAHCVVPEAEEILEKEFPVLDKGFIRLVDYMGCDQRIVQAARVSYGEGTKTLREDSALIDYLLRNDHTSPFEQVVFTFHAKMPVFVARQWVRHRMARLNEISGRYSVMSDEFYVPPLTSIAEQSLDNKQGRESVPMEKNKAVEVEKIIMESHSNSFSAYKELLEKNTAREIARIVLPLSLYTEWYWQIDLHNLFRFLKLRMDAHAQKEIREYAAVMKDLASKVCPMAFKSFESHIMGAVKFSSEEMEALEALLEGKEPSLKGKKLKRFEEKIKSGRQL